MIQTEPTAAATARPERFPNRWALFPIGLLAILVSVQLVLLSLSRNDPSFAVEPEYYQKAVGWDRLQEQRQANAQLGWQATVILQTASPELSVQLRDGAGRPLTEARVTALAFPNARAALQQELTLSETSPGIYASPVRVIHPGEWEIRLTATRQSETFTHVARVTPAPGR